MLTVRQIAELRDDVEKLSRVFDAGDLAPFEAEAVVRDTAAAEAMLASIKQRAAARVAESKAWKQAGHASAAHWLAAKSGTTVGVAREQLATTERLRALPEVRDAAERGELSAEQAAAIADAAKAKPDAAPKLLDTAKTKSLAELRDECRRAKAAGDPDPNATYRRIHAARSARAWTDPEGARHLHVRGPADVVATIEGRINAAADTIFKTAHADGRREPREAYQFDALRTLVCDRDTLVCDRDTGESPAPAPAPKARRRANNPAHLTLLRADLAAIVRGAVQGDELCEIAGVGPLPVFRLRELLGDSILKLVLTNGTGVANITHLGRGPTTAQLVAALWQSPTCLIEGCNRTDIEFDHHHDWARTHTTRSDNLGGLCHHDHDLKSRGWQLHRNPNGTYRLEPPP